jgi:molybdopterin converting factor small subunit
MILRVRLFARARDLAGADTVAIEVLPGATVGDLRKTLAARWPALASLLPRSALAVDNEWASDTLELGPDSEVALLPPVSGG